MWNMKAYHVKHEDLDKMYNMEAYITCNIMAYILPFSIYKIMS